MMEPISASENFEVLLPRLGDYLLQEGAVTSQSLQEALEYQSVLQTKGRKILIGQALLELGLIEASALDQIITKQIFDLHNALRQSNEKLEEKIFIN